MNYFYVWLIGYVICLLQVGYNYDNLTEDEAFHIVVYGVLWPLILVLGIMVFIARGIVGIGQLLRRIGQ